MKSIYIYTFSSKRRYTGTRILYGGDGGSGGGGKPERGLYGYTASASGKRERPFRKRDRVDDDARSVYIRAKPVASGQIRLCARVGRLPVYKRYYYTVMR